MKPLTGKKAQSLAEKVGGILEKLYPDAACSLDYGVSPWRLLVMARLSAQCTDERVNKVSMDLFRDYPDARAMADAPIEDIENHIKSCGLYHGKAKSISEFSRIICDEYGGSVPNTMDELLSLPGVGRKIANLILGDVYGLGGIVADTHCIRICGRLGFYDTSVKDAAKVEKIMETSVPRERQSEFCHRIVMFGREWCMARLPRCGDCPMKEICRTGRKNPGKS